MGWDRWSLVSLRGGALRRVCADTMTQNRNSHTLRMLGNIPQRSLLCSFQQWRQLTKVSLMEKLVECERRHIMKVFIVSFSYFTLPKYSPADKLDRKNTETDLSWPYKSYVVVRASWKIWRKFFEVPHLQFAFSVLLLFCFFVCVCLFYHTNIFWSPSCSL